MNDLTIFESPEFGSIRTVEEDGEPWLVGKDVAQALGYTDTDQALRRHVDDEDKLTRNFDGSGQNRSMTIINESGLYSLVLSSKLPTAKQFKRWITSEVIPAIRKNGGYIAGQNELSPEELMAKALKVANDVLAAREARISELYSENVRLIAENEAQRQVIADFEPVRQYVDTILHSKGSLATSQIAADYGISARALNRILHEEGIQHKVNSQWILYREHMGKGWTDSRTIQFIHSDGRPDAKMMTYWTQKGRMMIHNLLAQRGIVPVMDREGA